ncbi:MAG: hypothetical protein ACOCNA_04915, partial [Prevotella pectinovora]
RLYYLIVPSPAIGRLPHYGRLPQIGKKENFFKSTDFSRQWQIYFSKAPSQCLQSSTFPTNQ